MFVNISDDDKPCFSKRVQLFIALDKLAEQKNSELFNLEEIVDLSAISSGRKNIFAFGIAVSQLNLSEQEAEQVLEDK